MMFGTTSVIPQRLVALGFRWEYVLGHWIRDDGIECRQLSRSCWRLSRLGEMGSRLVSSPIRHPDRHRADIADRIALEVASMIAERAATAAAHQPREERDDGTTTTE